jgi:hypothetical protein
MGWFSKEYDKNSHPEHMKQHNAKKAMKETKRGTPERAQKRREYRMTKGERLAFVKEAARRGKGRVVEGAKITNKAPFMKVSTFAKRIRNGQCPCCGIELEKGKDVCSAFNGPSNVTDDIEDFNEAMQTHLPDGRNINGLTPGDPEWAHYHGPKGVRKKYL